MGRTRSLSSTQNRPLRQPCLAPEKVVETALPTLAKEHALSRYVLRPPIWYLLAPRSTTHPLARLRIRRDKRRDARVGCPTRTEGSRTTTPRRAFGRPLPR